MALTALDILVVLLVGAGLVLGFLRGFAAELLSLIAWILAILALSYFHERCRGCSRGPVGSGAWRSPSSWCSGSSFVLGKLASRRLGSRVRRSVVGPIDRCSAAPSARSRPDRATRPSSRSTSCYRHDVGADGGAAAVDVGIAQLALLETSGAAVSDLVEARRGPAAAAGATPDTANAQ